MSYSNKRSTEVVESVEEFLARTNGVVEVIAEGVSTLDRPASLNDTPNNLSTFGRLDRLTGGTMTDHQLLVMSEAHNCE